MSLEAWLEFRNNERYEPDGPMCYHCGGDCSGDVTEHIEMEVDGILMSGEFPICDDPDNCPANK